MTVHGSCLCGDVAWEVDGPLDFMSHCHCSRCRKAHGSAFQTSVMCDAGDFRYTRGRERIARFQSSPDLCRTFCERCGTPVTNDANPWQGKLFCPAGALDDDIDVPPLGPIFVRSKAPRDQIPGRLPTSEG